MTQRTRIKVCGITDLKEALRIAELGVDALGFIFADKSPRRIDQDQARQIIAALPPFVDAVGVFVDQPLALVEEIRRYCGLTMIQLHGAEPPQYCEQVHSRVVKAFRIRPESSPDELSPYAGRVKGFLLDTFHKGMAGGTGETFDWALIRHLAPPGPVILAGGLTPNNVGMAVRQVRPFAVDANSGVEKSPGRKDLALVRELVAAVQQAVAECG